MASAAEKRKNAIEDAKAVYGLRRRALYREKRTT